MTSSNTNYLLKAPPPHTFNMTLGIKFLKHELFGDTFRPQGESPQCCSDTRDPTAQPVMGPGKP
jgi:hypothetical protein